MRRTGTGRGVAIYVFDGGVSDQHAELAGRVRIGFDAFPSTPRICNAHGTAVAGAAAGATLGVAPEAEIVDVKIINCDHMRGSVGAIVDAARWTVQDHRRHPGQPAIANWSFAVDTTRNVPEVDSALVMLRDAGILVVVAAGNFDIDACHVSPANAPRAGRRCERAGSLGRPIARVAGRAREAHRVGSVRRPLRPRRFGSAPGVRS
jgi:subtilisin family serine protease